MPLLHAVRSDRSSVACEAFKHKSLHHNLIFFFSFAFVFCIPLSAHSYVRIFLFLSISLFFFCYFIHCKNGIVERYFFASVTSIYLTCSNFSTFYKFFFSFVLLRFRCFFFSTSPKWHTFFAFYFNSARMLFITFLCFVLNICIVLFY